MNIIHIKQSIKTKVNKMKTREAIKKTLPEILDSKDFEYVVVSTDKLGVGAGGELFIASNIDRTKYAVISIGASNKDMLCVLEDLSEINRSFEYVMFIDKKITSGKSVEEIVESFGTNKDITEALTIMGKIAVNGRYSTLVSGMFGDIVADDNKTDRYSSVSMTDLRTSDLDHDVEMEVVGKRGKVHLLHVVPLVRAESDALKYLDDHGITEIFTLFLIKEGKGSYSNRRKSFNFASMIDLSKLDRETVETAGLKFEGDRPAIYKVEDIEKALSLL